MERDAAGPVTLCDQAIISHRRGSQTLCTNAGAFVQDPDVDAFNQEPRINRVERGVRGARGPGFRVQVWGPGIGDPYASIGPPVPAK